MEQKIDVRRLILEWYYNLLYFFMSKGLSKEDMLKTSVPEIIALYRLGMIDRIEQQIQAVHLATLPISVMSEEGASSVQKYVKELEYAKMTKEQYEEAIERKREEMNRSTLKFFGLA